MMRFLPTDSLLLRIIKHEMAVKVSDITTLTHSSGGSEVSIDLLSCSTIMKSEPFR